MLHHSRRFVGTLLWSSEANSCGWRCYHFRRSPGQNGGEHEEFISTRSRRRSNGAHRLAATCDPTVVGKDACGADDGALFCRSRYGLRKAQSAADVHRQAAWAARQTDLHEREAFFQEQSYRQEVSGRRPARLSARAAAVEGMPPRISRGRRREMHAASSSILRIAFSTGLGPRDVQTYGPSPTPIWRMTPVRGFGVYCGLEPFQ
jgi:hypothetical protein